MGMLVADKRQLQTLENQAGFAGSLDIRLCWIRKQMPWILVLLLSFTCYVTSINGSSSKPVFLQETGEDWAA